MKSDNEFWSMAMLAVFFIIVIITTRTMSTINSWSPGGRDGRHHGGGHHDGAHHGGAHHGGWSGGGGSVGGHHG
jgi:hypothetical protein